MELIIDFDNIKEPSKREWLIRTLKLLEISFHTSGDSQTIDQYNHDLEGGDDEIEKGDFITALDLKKEVRKW